MPVTSFNTDLETMTITIIAEFAAPVERIWELYADPRQLEQVWGPPEFPATFVDHSLQPGGRTNYFMTSPEGEKYCGYWEVTFIDEPKGFKFDDGFADEDFNVNPDMPVSKNDFRFDSTDGGTRATYVSVYPSAEALQQVVEMGVEEGTIASINQIDAFLAG